MKTFIMSMACLMMAFSLRGEKVAVIGGGGAGLATTWLLEEEHDVVLYEAQDRLGGHAYTVFVETEEGKAPIDAGFEFISKGQFPHFFSLLRALNVAVNPFTLITTFYRTDGSDVIVLPPYHNGKIEWDSIDNVLDLVQLDYMIEKGKRVIEIQDVGISLEDFIENLRLTSGFKNDFLYPFLAAGWGVSIDQIKEFAAYDALKYIIMGKEEKDYEWYEIAGGTSAYIDALVKQLKSANIKLSSNIIKITHGPGGYRIIEEDGTAAEYDHLVLATHAKEAKKLLEDIPETEDIRSLLSHVRYFKTSIAIHGDTRFMPPDKGDWRVVNIAFDGTKSANTVYKKWLSPTPIFKSWITWDLLGFIPDNLYALIHFEHPIVDLKYYQVQKAIGMVQGNRRLWFAGNWTYDNDSHESAIMSALKIAEKLAPESRRLGLVTSSVR